MDDALGESSREISAEERLARQFARLHVVVSAEKRLKLDKGVTRVSLRQGRMVTLQAILLVRQGGGEATVRKDSHRVKRGCTAPGFLGTRGGYQDSAGCGPTGKGSATSELQLLEQRSRFRPGGLPCPLERCGQGLLLGIGEPGPTGLGDQ